MDRAYPPDEALTLERQIRIAAHPETLFPYFTDPDRMVRWMGRTATLEPRPGGIFRVDYGKGDVVRGEFREIEAPHRVVLTWGWEAEGDAVPPGASTVEVELESDGDGTLLTLRHLGLPPDSRAGHAEGWDHFLPRLAETARA